MTKRRKMGETEKIAFERINELFKFAEEITTSEKFSTIPEQKRQSYADRYVELARKIAMKLQITIPSEHKKKFCNHCYTYLIPGKNCRVRTREGKLVTYCERCKKFMRKELKKDKQDEEGKTSE